MLMRLTLALTMLAPTPTQKEADAAYNAQQFGRALDLFLARAADPSVHRPDALSGVHDSLVALHEQTGKAENLCRALKITRDLLASGPFADEDERAAWVALEAKDVVRVKRAGVRCAATVKMKPAASPVVAANGSTPAPPAAAVPATVDPHAPDEVLAPVTGRASAPRLATTDTPAGETLSSAPHTTPPSPGNADGRASEPLSPASPGDDRHARKTTDRSPVKPSPPRGRGLVIAGGVTLGVGLAVTAAAGYLSGGLLDTWRESRALYDETGPIGTEVQADRNAALTHEYQQQKAPMVATAILGASALIVGAVLAGVGAKRLARATARTALLPMPGGLVLRARF